MFRHTWKRLPGIIRDIGGHPCKAGFLQSTRGLLLVQVEFVVAKGGLNRPHGVQDGHHLAHREAFSLHPAVLRAEGLNRPPARIVNVSGFFSDCPGAG